MSLTLGVTAAAFVVIAWLETRRPLRERREPRGRRTARNLAMAGLSAASATILQWPLLAPLVSRVEAGGLGILNRLAANDTARTVLGILLLDYTLWWWHWMNHKWPLLWRFHLVHHVDRDLDASTALRFHFGEISLSVFFRMAQVRLLGVSPAAIAIWQLLLMVSILFHHSNIRLSPQVDRFLTAFVVTPRMHGIHHSEYRRETDSNWSSLLSWWDWLHGTMRLDTPQSAITIGVPAWQQPDDVTLPKIVAIPFREQRDDWKAMDGVRKIERT